MQSPLVGNDHHGMDDNTRCRTGSLQNNSIGIHLNGGQQYAVGTGSKFGYNVDNGRLHSVPNEFERVVRGITRLPGIGIRIPRNVGDIELAPLNRHITPYAELELELELCNCRICLVRPWSVRIRIE